MKALIIIYSAWIDSVFAPWAIEYIVPNMCACVSYFIFTLIFNTRHVCLIRVLLSLRILTFSILIIIYWYISWECVSVVCGLWTTERCLNHSSWRMLIYLNEFPLTFRILISISHFIVFQSVQIHHKYHLRYRNKLLKSIKLKLHWSHD